MLTEAGAGPAQMLGRQCPPDIVVVQRTIAHLSSMGARPVDARRSEGVGLSSASACEPSGSPVPLLPRDRVMPCMTSHQQGDCTTRQHPKESIAAYLAANKQSPAETGE